ncbi:MAG TPA: GSCFA domain-containing protein [Chitinophagaceae bacterium]|nr:GSCFA domain-containing protein [Chitinophagaceae bacterium]
MDFMVNIDLKKLPRQINYTDKILLIGSCFTEHIGESLRELKFSILQNPNGILFDPNSVAESLVSYTQNKRYGNEDFFQLNDIWHSWQHHSRYSNTNLEDAVRSVNASQKSAHDFLKNAGWIIITLGSAFSYQLTENAIKTAGFSKEAYLGSLGVANCHRAPAKWFNKHLMTIDEIVTTLDNALRELFQFNSTLEVIFTVSPVRHIRDGVVNNNRSKARLIESVHQLVQKFERAYYFPAYELVIDVLRDYRFYDVDLVHPNYMATEFVLEKFAECCIDESSRILMEEVKKIVIARKHKAFQPSTTAHKQFLQSYVEKTRQLKAKHPFLDLAEEINYFQS